MLANVQYSMPRLLERVQIEVQEVKARKEREGEGSYYSTSIQSVFNIHVIVNVPDCN